MAFPITTQSSGSPPFVSRIEENSAGEAAAATPTPTTTTTTTSIPAHLIVSEREMPELSGIIEEVSSPTAPPAMSAKAQAILATTRCVNLPPGWSRVFYSHAVDGLDLKKKGPSPQQQPSREIKKAYSVYYVTSSGRVLLSAEEAMHFLHRADVACRCFLLTAGLAFNEVFSFEADIGTVPLHSRNDLLLSDAAAVSSHCLDWCATFHGHLELEDRLRTTKRYMLHRETAHPLEAYSLAKLRATSSINNNNNGGGGKKDDDSLSSISAEFEPTAEVAAMLTSSRRELLVTEEGQVYVRALTADHLKHLTYELWLAGVNTDLPNRSRAVASNNDDQEEQEEEEFAAFFDGPVFGRRLGRAGRREEEEAKTAKKVCTEEGRQAAATAAAAAAAASAAPKQPKKRKKRKRIIPRDLNVRLAKPVPEETVSSSLLRRSKRPAAAVARVKNRWIAQKVGKS
ncbi:hypothetical protein TYRP_021814 [Tyrophagus putrescentiae]|nr:hypothetical protein TYRP_021814 [Tyrophagus putrescentiae]